MSTARFDIRSPDYSIGIRDIKYVRHPDGDKRRIVRLSQHYLVVDLIRFFFQLPVQPDLHGRSGQLADGFFQLFFQILPATRSRISVLP
jgi:hypothetical protein